MAIKILEDRIEFDNYSLVTSGKGLGVVSKNSTTELSDIEATSITLSSYSFQGTEFGYISGGYSTSPTTLDYTQSIQKFPLAIAGGLLKQVASLSVAQGHGLTGCKSAINGYTCGGFYNMFSRPQATVSPPGNVGPYYLNVSTKSRLSYSSDYNILEGGILEDGSFDYAAGNSSSTNGYLSGGRTGSFSPFLGYATYGAVSRVRRFSFTSDNNGVIVNNLLNVPEVGNSNAGLATGCSSATDAHVLNVDTLHKFPYANETSQTFLPNAVPGGFHGFLTAGFSSVTHGYIAGGSLSVPGSFAGTATGNFVGGYPGVQNPSFPYGPGDAVRNISKFPFASLAVVANVGNLTYKRGSATGISSIAHGIVVGGRVNPALATGSTLIERFPFAADVNGIEVGDIGTDRNGAAGFQY